MAATWAGRQYTTTSQPLAASAPATTVPRLPAPTTSTRTLALPSSSVASSPIGRPPRQVGRSPLRATPFYQPDGVTAGGARGASLVRPLQTRGADFCAAE